MELVGEIVKQGAMGILAAVAFWLFIDERKAHNQTRKDLMTEKDARRGDAVQTLEKIEQPLSSIALSQQFIADKITAVKRGEV